MRRWLCLFLLSLAALVGCDDWQRASPPPSVIETPALTGEAPWTGTAPLRDEDDFDFVVVSDRTVGHRDGVFEEEMPRKVNLLRPEFVISVGDLIEGYTEDRAQLAREWDELEAAIDKLDMPFFYVPGNHDLSNAVMAEIWRSRFGPSYYYFRYRDVLFLVLNSELFGQENDPAQRLADPRQQAEQMAYLAQALRENGDARWTFVFVHQPFWDLLGYPPSQAPPIDADWLKVEQQLGSRPYTVFAGHYHSYTLHVRNDRQFITLATTGGGSKLRGTAFGEFDQIAHVTMTRAGPLIANLRLDGILPSDVVTKEQREEISSAPAIQSEPVTPPGAGPRDPFRRLQREILKTLFCAVLAFGSWCVFAAAAGKPWEMAALRRSVILVTLAKPILCLALYLSQPSAFFASDAAVYYLPETLRWLSGEIPYRDFRSGYAPLFHLLLMPAVLAWPAPGSVVVTLLAMETLLIVLYARRFGRSRGVHSWRVLFLHCFSPISFYWVALTGYNSVLIALFALIALLLAEARRDLAAGFTALLGLAFSKLTMVLAWPAIVFFPGGSVVRRIAPLVGLLLLFPALIYWRINILQDALDAGYIATSGNLWFLVSLLLPEGSESRSLKFVSMLSLFIALSIMLVFYLRRARPQGEGFDQASAFYAACCLVFMLLAYKTFPWYLTMCLIFLLHTLVGASRSSAAALLPFAVLGAVTTFEPGLSFGLRTWLGPHWRAVQVSIDLVVIACLAYYAWHCFRIAIGRGPLAGFAGTARA